MRRKNDHPRAKASLRVKLILSYLLLLLLPLSALAGYAYVSIDALLVRQTGDAYREIVRQAAMAVDHNMSGYQIAASAVCNNERLLSTLRVMRIRNLTLGEEYDSFRQLRAVMDSVSYLQGVVHVRLAVGSNATFVSEMLDIFSVGLLESDSSWPLPVRQVSWVQSDTLSMTRSSDRSSFQMILRINDPAYQSKALGYLLVEVDASTLFTPLERLTIPEGGLVLLRGQSMALCKAGFDNEGFADAVSRTKESRYLTIEMPMAYADWTLSVSYPRRGLLRGDMLPLTFLWAAVLLSAVGIGFALLVTQSINKRLKMTLAGIQRMESGEIGALVPVIGSDEYSRVQEAFNTMSLKTQQLVEDLTDAQALRKQAEMRVLYEQINPHFVYNTLDIIHWEALRNHAKPLAELVDRLVIYLRNSLNQGQEMVEVSREIEMLSSYIHIMNYRFQGTIDYSVDIAPDILNIQIPKMILQPLVENAVLHGIMGTQQKAGVLRLKAWSEGDTLCFLVQDDGAGMDSETLDGLFTSRESHYGLWNVQKRIQARYGSSSGLTFRSAPGEGTDVTVRLENVYDR